MKKTQKRLKINFKFLRKEKLNLIMNRKKVLEKINKTDLEVFKVINLQGVTGSGKLGLYGIGKNKN